MVHRTTSRNRINWSKMSIVLKIKSRILSILASLTSRLHNLALLSTEVAKSSLPGNKKTSVFTNKGLPSFCSGYFQLPMNELTKEFLSGLAAPLHGLIPPSSGKHCKCSWKDWIPHVLAPIQAGWYWELDYNV